ncbi:hypothetical protein M3Y99_01257900 [Aphelenchoides fujianensis]|nr:hypothetical protein M3Y99_01257900 [Aphelenchoides fujianensis]
MSAQLQPRADGPIATAHSRSPLGSTEATGGTTSRASVRSAAPPAELLIRTRFWTTVGVLLSMGLAALAAHRLLTAESFGVRVAGGLLVLLLAFFAHEWCWVHASGLTRQKRAHFDEVNILETYQPRARTHGHLFVPDPPTPGPTVNIKEGDVPERSAEEKAAWIANRDAVSPLVLPLLLLVQHYQDMFGHAMRVAREQEALEKAAAAQQPPAAVVQQPPGEAPPVKEEPSTRTALPKDEDAPATAREASQREDVVKPLSNEVTARADVNALGEPLYENITPLEGELPAPPRPSATEQLQTVARDVARRVSSKVRTALDTGSLRGMMPGLPDVTTPPARSPNPPPEKPKDGEPMDEPKPE